MSTLQTLTLAAARQLIFAAETKAYQLATPCNIALVDVTGHLIAYVRMDGARCMGAEESINKALNSLAVEICIKTKAEQGLLEHRERVQCSGTGHPGGVAITSANQVVGAIGVSGGSTDADFAIAVAALAAYQSALETGQSTVAVAGTSQSHVLRRRLSVSETHLLAGLVGASKGD